MIVDRIEIPVKYKLVSSVSRWLKPTKTPMESDENNVIKGAVWKFNLMVVIFFMVDISKIEIIFNFDLWTELPPSFYFKLFIVVVLHKVIPM